MIRDSTTMYARTLAGMGREERAAELNAYRNRAPRERRRSRSRPAPTWLSQPLRNREADRLRRSGATPKEIADALIAPYQAARLRADVAPRFNITVESFSVRETIRAAVADVRRREGADVETGGHLFDTRCLAGSDFHVVAATVAVEKATPDSLHINDEGVRDFAAAQGLELVGCWHTHPSGGSVPSQADVTRWAGWADWPDRPAVWAALLVGPSRESGSWSYPSLTGWATYREAGHSFVCEPARVIGSAAE